MSSSTRIRLGVWQGRPSITLVSGERGGTFLPAGGVLGASPRRDNGTHPARRDAPPHAPTRPTEDRLDAGSLRITTEITPTGRTAVPVSFCWHPFFRTPGAPKRAWERRWPACERVLVNERV